MNQLDLDLPGTSVDIDASYLVLEMYQAHHLPNLAPRVINVTATDNFLQLRWTEYTEAMQGGAERRLLEIPITQEVVQELQQHIPNGKGFMTNILRRLVYNSRDIKSTAEKHYGFPA